MTSAISRHIPNMEVTSLTSHIPHMELTSITNITELTSLDSHISIYGHKRDKDMGTNAACPNMDILYTDDISNLQIWGDIYRALYMWRLSRWPYKDMGTNVAFPNMGMLYTDDICNVQTHS